MRTLLVSVFLTLITAPVLAQKSDVETAAARAAERAYHAAQKMKRENRFNEARLEFEAIARLEDSGTEKWADLAADELNYGLPLHEANYWVLQLGASGNDAKARESYIANAEELYQKIISLNADDVERVRDAQQRIDQLYVARQALENASSAQALAHLSRLRVFIAEHYHSQGEWPDQRTLAAELKATLKLARLAPNRFLIKNYWHSKDSYYALLRDANGGPDIKITGNEHSSTIERVSR